MQVGQVPNWENQFLSWTFVVSAGAYCHFETGKGLPQTLSWEHTIHCRIKILFIGSKDNAAHILLAI